MDAVSVVDQAYLESEVLATHGPARAVGVEKERWTRTPGIRAREAREFQATAAES